MNAHALRSALEDIISVYEWCSVDPIDRGYSALDNEISRAKHLLANSNTVEAGGAVSFASKQH
jgi:hypothetical protein